MLDCVGHLSYRELEHQIDRLVFGVLLLNTSEHALRLFPVPSFSALSATSVAASRPLYSFLAVLLDDTQTDNLVAIVDQLVNQPFQSRVGIIVCIGAAKEGPRSLRVLVISVFAVESEGEIGCVLVVKCVERDTGLELPAEEARRVSVGDQDKNVNKKKKKGIEEKERALGLEPTRVAVDCSVSSHQSLSRAFGCGFCFARQKCQCWA